MSRVHDGLYIAGSKKGSRKPCPVGRRHAAIRVPGPAPQEARGVQRGTRHGTGLPYCPATPPAARAVPEPPCGGSRTRRTRNAGPDGAVGFIYGASVGGISRALSRCSSGQTRKRLLQSVSAPLAPGIERPKIARNVVCDAQTTIPGRTYRGRRAEMPSWTVFLAPHGRSRNPTVSYLVSGNLERPQWPKRSLTARDRTALSGQPRRSTAHPRRDSERALRSAWPWGPLASPPGGDGHRVTSPGALRWAGESAVLIGSPVVPEGRPHGLSFQSQRSKTQNRG